MRLYLMRVATMAEDTPVPCYLIRTDDGQVILIDTGFSPALAAAAREPGHQGPPIREYVSVVDQLAALGVRPEDVGTLVATHLDPDHAGMADAFPNAEIVIQRAQLEAARAATHPRYAMTRAQWDAPGLRYRPVDGDTELAPGVTLIETGGHVPGHQSVLVRLPTTGPILLAIDAIGSAGQADPETRERRPADLDDAAARTSARKLRDLAAREGVTLTVYGHDGPQWQTLKLVPDYYD
jgi:N-acyl homoserine lactone hydrolase